MSPRFRFCPVAVKSGSRFRLAEVEDAYRHLAGKAIGKVVVVV
tara:strand:+ start:1744 stop:1872 length:129 start_codon:yes stop_codon:yes gene_type:complete